MKFDLRYEGFSDNFLPGSPQPLKGWETLILEDGISKFFATMYEVESNAVILA